MGICESGNSNCVEAFSVFCNVNMQGLGWQICMCEYMIMCVCVCVSM